MSLRVEHGGLCLSKKNKKTSLEDFLSKHDVRNEEFEELETISLERDTLYDFTILGHNTFDGKFGPAVAVTIENDEGKFKTFLNGFEVSHFNNFIEGVELPVKVNLARIQVESASNEGRTYNKLVIATV